MSYIIVFGSAVLNAGDVVVEDGHGLERPAADRLPSICHSLMANTETFKQVFLNVMFQIIQIPMISFITIQVVCFDSKMIVVPRLLVYLKLLIRGEFQCYLHGRKQVLISNQSFYRLI